MNASSRFLDRKRKILEQLDAPDEVYHDLSPKGSVDLPIRALIRDINRLDGLVTTSSCSGRISAFLEGSKRAEASLPEPQETTIAGPGGKGGGGLWLFISHDAISMPEDGASSSFMSDFGLRKCDSADGRAQVSSRYIHLKFEPMILHILTASLEDSQRVLTAALGSGFRESGAVSLTAKNGELNPMVAVRSTGYSFDAIIGYRDDAGNNIALVDEAYLHTLVDIANARFKINTERIARFQASLVQQYIPQPDSGANSQKPEWEDVEVRKQRKREEGLARQRALRENPNGTETSDVDMSISHNIAPTGIFDS
ncbi:hypothetical protein CC80DRAFT_487578 [Byssothecium circinans]|uniref:tRNA(Phe) 7-[(3-amino-3-carboxypropyl)-4-demethylwyosine(37)-N(4)]-methyltransferase n=1 Tax=Byssothecium circinans TaxID=147558 RepID=A0A6A5UHD6_9PLEO|nr:hypothetical protein CC80DRAFT_487578 [Byssothecium circinans]